MKPPTQLELQNLLAHEYDKAKAHEYYERTKKLKGRKKKHQHVGRLIISKPKAKLRMHRQHAPTKVAPTRSNLTPAQKARIRRQEAAQKILIAKQQAIAKAKLEKQQATERAQAEKQKAVKLKQTNKLTAQIKDLEGKLKKLEDLIAAKTREEASQARVLFSVNRMDAAEAAKPPTAAEKTQAARESSQYRDQNQQKVKTAAKTSAAAKKTSAPAPTNSAPSTNPGMMRGFSVPSSSSASKTAESQKAQVVADLKTLATKVKGEIAVAKQKLAAL